MICPKKPNCEHCDRTATRIISHVDKTNEQPNFHWWQIFHRFKRHWIDHGVYSKELYCERHYMERNFGLVTFDCPKCKCEFKVDYDFLMDHFFEDQELKCPLCGTKVTSEYDDYEKEIRTSKHGIACVLEKKKI